MTRRTVGRAGAGALVLVGLAASLALAGSITINMTTRTELTEKELKVVLTVGNSGDEAAGSVVPILRLRDREVRAPREDVLPPGGRIERTLAVPADDLGDGRWPFRVAVSYTDQNQYPFQALHVSMITRGNPLPAKIAVTKIESSPLERTATVSMTLKNLAAVERTATITLWTPEDIEVQGGPASVSLAGWGEDRVEFELTNRTALAGSRYPVFAAVEYDEPGAHHSVIGQTTVEIRSPRAFLPRVLLWVVGGLIVLWLAILGWRMRSRR